VVLVAVTVVIVNALVWVGLNRPDQQLDWNGRFTGLSFNPYRAGDSPLENRYPGEAEVAEDLKLAATVTGRVRTYSSADISGAIPRLAADAGLKVTAGAWLESNRARNDTEVDALIRNARQYRSVERVIVGNESVLRGDLSVDELVQYLRRVRKALRVPVSTAEPWHVWIRNPRLVREVDFITIHLLPYWEGVPSESAVDFVREQYDKIHRAYPDKRVLIGEVGWPSYGNRLQQAKPSLASEAQFIRGFLNLAMSNRYDYFLMEAFDQPWKREIEGSVGPHWGVFNVDRQLKFPLSGPIEENPRWRAQLGLASVLALLPMLVFLWRWSDLRARGQLFYASMIQLVASTLAWTLFAPWTHHLTLTATVMWALLLPAQLLLLAVALINAFELTELNWLKSRRTFAALKPAAPARLPKVSIHLPIHNEPADMVKLTLDSLARLDYPDFEVIVIDNNTADPEVWRPVEAHCQALGSRFRFFSLGKWPGFKAGALNFALAQTAADAGVIGVIDSDYIVRPDWLSALVPYFENPRVGFVQAPQDHREWDRDGFQEMINWEYAGFFHIGMVHRNERNAIIQHGTMTLIRRAALDSVGGWAQWTICEDAELGLRLFEAGLESVYVNEPFGQGLTPQSFAGYKGQRFRWTYGAIQILRGHWRQLMPWSGRSQLTAAQRYHFLTGWLPWFADGLHLVFTLAALAWTLGLIVYPRYVEYPLAAFVVPTVGMFAFKVLHAFWLYARRVPATLRQRVGAAVAGMALTHTIARAVMRGLVSRNQPFFRTPKAENRPALWKGFAMAREELLVLAALWTGVLALLNRYGTGHAEALVWSIILFVQSMPYLAAGMVSFVNAAPSRTPATARDKSAVRVRAAA